ncbi:MAG: hypothetical protein I3J03_00365 [Actinomyces succiniciruminis]|uniref:Uncharacterized protein n=1 Tax=Actinomyces succiniciruminis TaxID=1522002 RepID=A0A1L7RCH3_9ACTO|nr:hypothetical protein [Actinomyces succiniciruminis]MBM6978164.1 hypothetical protein [Actinomyces succiniciruminis]CED91637.1 Hypothetical protein AAM4_1805 [Actinomyces succiniciruminis]
MTEHRVPADLEASWAPIGWEPSDIGFDDAPFGSVLGDPLMGSPIFDVSVLDAAPASDVEGAQPRPAQTSGASRPAATAPPSSRTQHQQTTQRASHRQSTARPQAQPPSRPVPAPSGYGLTPTASGGGPVGLPGTTPTQAAPGAAGRSPYPRPQVRMPQQPGAAVPANAAQNVPQAPRPRPPARQDPYGRPPVPAPTGSRPAPQPRNQSNQNQDTSNIEKLVTTGIGWVVFILIMIIFAAM